MGRTYPKRETQGVQPLTGTECLLQRILHKGDLGDEELSSIPLLFFYSNPCTGPGFSGTFGRQNIINKLTFLPSLEIKGLNEWQLKQSDCYGIFTLFTHEEHRHLQISPALTMCVGGRMGGVKSDQ